MAKLSKIDNKIDRIALKSKIRRSIKMDTILQIIQICLLALIAYKVL